MIREKKTAYMTKNTMMRRRKRRVNKQHKKKAQNHKQSQKQKQSQNQTQNQSQNQSQNQTQSQSQSQSQNQNQNELVLKSPYISPQLLLVSFICGGGWPSIVSVGRPVDAIPRKLFLFTDPKALEQSAFPSSGMVRDGTRLGLLAACPLTMVMGGTVMGVGMGPAKPTMFMQNCAGAFSYQSAPLSTLKHDLAASPLMLGARGRGSGFTQPTALQVWSSSLRRLLL